MMLLPLILAIKSVVLWGQVDEKLMPARVIGLEYPMFARMAGSEGEVTLTLVIGKSGVVETIQEASGPLPLLGPSKACASRWIYPKATQVHKVLVTFTYSLLPGNCDPKAHCSSEFEITLPNKVVVRAQKRSAVVD